MYNVHQKVPQRYLKLTTFNYIYATVMIIFIQFAFYIVQAAHEI